MKSHYRSTRLALALAAACSAAFATSDLPPSPGPVHVRLLTPLSSVHSEPGSEFRAVVIAPLRVSDRVLMPPGTTLYGTVVSRKSVGLGLPHERASLSLAFHAYQLADGRRFSLQARLRKVENGREYVTPDGEMKGILAADSPQAVVGGVWTRPTLTLLQRSPMGLTGVSGRIWKSYALGPFGAIGLFALRCAMFRMPEPDIQLPIGAEMSVTVLRVPDDAPMFDRAEPSPVPSDLAEFLRNQPFIVTKANGRRVKDIINIAFDGTREELLNAFRAAGWSVAGPLTARSFSQEITAFNAKRGYSDAPASPLAYEGESSSFVFEKSLNSVTMRHHVRVWKAPVNGREVWLGAATHDVGVGFDMRGFKFSHRIQSHIDWERRKIADDLTFAGCTDGTGFVERPDAVASPFDGAGILTDGQVAVLHLHACKSAGAFTPMDRLKPVGPFVARMARRVVLETRQYVERENTFFWAYRAIKWGRAARRNQTVVDEDY